MLLQNLAKYIGNNDTSAGGKRVNLTLLREKGVFQGHFDTI